MLPLATFVVLLIGLESEQLFSNEHDIPTVKLDFLMDLHESSVSRVVVDEKEPPVSLEDPGMTARHVTVVRELDITVDATDPSLGRPELERLANVSALHDEKQAARLGR